MTYISIRTQIAELERSGKLVRFAPKARRPLKRRLFMTSELEQVLCNENSAVVRMEGSGPIKAAMEKWVRGERIYKGFLKRLRPPPNDIWEMRVTQPTPQWRLFCRFAYPSTLIVTNVHSRPYLGPEFVRKRQRSKAWLDAMNECEASWNKLFPDSPPHKDGERSGDYISDPVDDFKV